MTIPLSPLGERFENDAGWIQNLAEQPVGGVAVLFCKAGSSRSHHGHETDHHTLFVVSGAMRYVEKPFGGDEQQQRTVRAGEAVFTGPRLWHSTYFDEDTVLVSLSKRSRTHAEHEADVVRCAALPWVEE